MHAGDEFYEQSLDGSTEKAEYKVATLMKHGYIMQQPEKAIVLHRDCDKLVILPNGDVYKKVIY